MPDQPQPVLRCTQLAKFYRQGDARIDVLKGVELSVYAGQRIAIVGTSGSGKSTLLSLLGALDSPSGGNIELAGNDPQAMDDRALSRLRNAQLGFVYQFHHLLPEFSALENVAMPLMIAGARRKAADAQALALLERVGLANRQTHLPAELSGGERQRVAIARALVNAPGCVLMDEPTGNLDSESAATIQQLISELSAAQETAFVVVTHDNHVAQMMDHIFRLQNGVLQLQQSDA